MKNTQYHKTKETSIYWYNTKEGKKFHVRINYKKANGKRGEKTKSGLINLTAAKRARTELQGIIDREETKVFDIEKVTFKEVRERYFNQNFRRWSVSTRKDMESINKKYLSRFDDLLINKFKKATYEEFINDLLFEKDLSVKYVRKIHQKMVAIFNDAVDEELLTTNRFKKVKIEKIEPTKKKKHLEKGELELYDRVAKDNLTAIKYACYVLMRVGLRKGEVLGFKKKSVNIIAKNVVDYTVDNSKTPHEEESTLKTNNSYRTIRLTGEYATAVLNAIDEARRIYTHHGCEFDDNSRIIINAHTCKTYNHKMPNVMLSKLNDISGIDVTPHMLRHSFATHGRQNGNDLVAVAKWLGNTPRVTHEVYSHVTDESHLRLVKFANAK